MTEPIWILRGRARPSSSSGAPQVEHVSGFIPRTSASDLGKFTTAFRRSRRRKEGQKTSVKYNSEYAICHNRKLETCSSPEVRRSSQGRASMPCTTVGSSRPIIDRIERQVPGHGPRRCSVSHGSSPPGSPYARQTVNTNRSYSLVRCSAWSMAALTRSGSNSRRPTI